MRRLPRILPYAATAVSLVMCAGAAALAGCGNAARRPSPSARGAGDHAPLAATSPVDSQSLVFSSVTRSPVDADAPPLDPGTRIVLRHADWRVVVADDLQSWVEDADGTRLPIRRQMPPGLADLERRALAGLRQAVPAGLGQPLDVTSVLEPMETLARLVSVVADGAARATDPAQRGLARRLAAALLADGPLVLSGETAGRQRDRLRVEMTLTPTGRRTLLDAVAGAADPGK